MTVPVGAKIAAILNGAAGAFNCYNSPGNGAELDVSFIARTTSLTLSVGAAGGGSAGGGAATSITLPDDTLVAIAGGGGNAGCDGEYYYSFAEGGDGGNAGGITGSPGGGGEGFGSDGGGGGGTQTAPGAGGTPGCIAAPNCGADGQPGSANHGGAGGGSPNNTEDGGAGGDGYFGGGGGGGGAVDFTCQEDYCEVGGAGGRRRVKFWRDFLGRQQYGRREHLPVHSAGRRTDLSVSLSNTVSTLKAGRSMTYCETVTNNGPLTATSVLVMLSVPPGLTITNPEGGTVSANTITWTVPKLLAGKHKNFKAAVHDTATSGTVLTRDSHRRRSRARPSAGQQLGNLGDRHHF